MPIELTLLNVSVNVQDVQGPAGVMRVMRVTDAQSGIVVGIPMSPAAAVKIGNDLAGRGLVVPDTPADLNLGGRAEQEPK